MRYLDWLEINIADAKFAARFDRNLSAAYSCLSLCRFALAVLRAFARAEKRVFRFAGGKAVETAAYGNDLEVMRQIGAVPRPAVRS